MPRQSADEDAGTFGPDLDAPVRDLIRFVPIETLRSLQERFARMGQVSVCICDTRGVAITVPTWGSSYSELIGTCPKGGTLFRAGLKASCGNIRGRDGVECLDGMTLHASPIDYEGQPHAWIVAGTRAALPPSTDAIRMIASGYSINADALIAAAEVSSPWTGGTPDTVYRFADLLAATIATLYRQGRQIGQQLADLRVVHGLAGMLAGSRGLQEILDLTVKQVVEVMPVKACGIRLLNEETGELVIKAVHNLSEAYLMKGPVMLRDSDIDADAFAGRAVRIEDVRTDPRIRYPENARREGIVGGLCLPMTFRGQTIGVIRVYTAKRHEFSESEERLLRSIGSQAASAIITSRLYEQQASTERIQRQVEAAADIQRRMLPSRPARRRHLEFGCVYEPTLNVGGDFYDFPECSSGVLGLCIADVVGKGMPAALMMASVRSALRAHLDSSNDLAEVVVKVNRHLCRDTLVGEFATLVVGEFSPDGRLFQYCNAGHVPPLLWRDDEFTELTIGGMVIGVAPDERFDVGTATLRPGDTLVFTTDGILEAMDYQGTMFGWDRLRT